MKNNKKAHPWKRPYNVNRAIELQLHTGYIFPVLDDLDLLPGVMTDEQVLAPYEALAALQTAE